MSMTPVPISIRLVFTPIAERSGNGEASCRAKWWTRTNAPSIPISSAAIASSTVWCSASPPVCVSPPPGCQAPNERKPIFFALVIAKLPNVVDGSSISACSRRRMNKTTLLGDKPISRMGFGAMQLSGPGAFGPPSDLDEARAVLRRAIELGVDHIDTAQYYGPDVVNDLIREALYPYPENLKLVTKVGARRDAAGGWHPAQQPDELRAGVEENLRSLRVERLALVNLRLVGGRSG